MKKTLAMLLVLVMALGLFAGCAQQDTTETKAPAAAATEAAKPAETEEKVEQVTVRVAYWNNEETMNDLLAFWAEAVPEAKVEFQFIENSQYTNIMDTQMASGEGPDLIAVGTADAVKYTQLGYLEDLSQYADRFADAGKKLYTSEDGKLYALPGLSWFEGIYFNTDLFKENNIELPTTFDEYLAVCKQFNELGIKPLAAGLKDWQPMVKNSYALVTADYLSKDEGKDFGKKFMAGETTFAETWKPYLENWSRMISEGVYTQDMLGIDPAQAMDEFVTGKAAMFCSGPWDLETLKQKNPDLNFDMMPFRGTEADEGWLIGGPGNGWAVNKDSKVKDVVMKMLDAYATPEGQKAFWMGSQGSGSYLKGIELDMPEQFNSVGATLSAGNVFCPWDEWSSVSAVIVDYGAELQNYLMGAETLDEVLANTDMKAAELMAK